MITLLLLSAAILGLLAFFEPCTIATHTLFSSRLHKTNDKYSSYQSMGLLWLSRSILLISIQYPKTTYFMYENFVLPFLTKHEDKID